MGINVVEIAIICILYVGETKIIMLSEGVVVVTESPRAYMRSRKGSFLNYTHSYRVI